MDWPFQEPKNLAVITTTRIVKNNAPILYIVHDEEGIWQFLDGDEVDTATAAVIGLCTLTQMDQSIFDTADLPIGWEAWRKTKDAIWERRKIS